MISLFLLKDHLYIQSWNYTPSIPSALPKGWHDKKETTCKASTNVFINDITNVELCQPMPWKFLDSQGGGRRAALLFMTCHSENT